MRRFLLIVLLLTPCAAQPAYVNGEYVVLTKEDFDMCFADCLRKMPVQPAPIQQAAPPAAQNGQTSTSSEQQRIGAYIAYLKDATTTMGAQADCEVRCDKYNEFFTGQCELQILASARGPVSGRLDEVCNINYDNWCFAAGFAYSSNGEHGNRGGYKCLTYQEYCVKNNKTFDSSKVDGYLQRIIEEIDYYHKNIRGKSTIAKWSGNTDKWINEKIPDAERIGLLCR